MNALGTPRVIVLTPQSPYPPHQGTSIRNYNLLIRLARRAQVHLITFIDADQPPPQNTPLAQCCASITALPAPVRSLRERLAALFTTPRPDLALRLHSHAMHQKVADLAKTVSPDIILVEGLEMAPYLTSLLAHVEHPPRVVFDAHNAEYILQKRAFLTDLRMPWRWHAAFYSLLQWLKLRRYEGHVCARVDHVIAVSPVDKQHLQSLAPHTPMSIVPNGVDVAYYTSYVPADTFTPLGPHAVVFTGKMDYRPNVDAALWFLTHVWSRVRQAVPDAQFYIVGRSPHPRILAQGDKPGVFITGAVPDIRPYLHQAAVFVIPMRVGGGTRLKLLEAMASRRAVVSTTLGAEGYPVQDGEHLLLADDPKSFAACVIQLLEDKTLRERLGKAAHKFVRTHYDWDQIAEQFVNVVMENAPPRNSARSAPSSEGNAVTGK